MGSNSSQLNSIESQKIRRTFADTDTKKMTCSGKSLKYFRDYTDKCSIHGLRLLTEPKRLLVERFWWSIFLTVSIYFCASLISSAYKKWERSPVIVSFATSETTVSEIPFPAVTVCPQTKFDKAKANFTKMIISGKEYTDVDEETYNKHWVYMFLACFGIQSHIVRAGKSFKIDDQMIDFLFKTQPNFEEDIQHSCYFSGVFCFSLHNPVFRPILTSEGICHTFNMLDRDEIFTDDMAKSYYETFSVPHAPKSQWTVETGYNVDTNTSMLTSFPIRTGSSGEDGGLTIILLTNKSNMDAVCRYGLQGFKVILHHPAQMPNAKQDYVRIGLNEFVTVSVTPTMMTTSDELIRYEPTIRKCYFATERKLRFFKTYNQQDCLMECLSNFTYMYCDCVEFYMPRVYGSRICNPNKDGLCVVEAIKTYHANDMSKNWYYPNMSFKRTNYSYADFTMNCNCLPPCFSLDYQADVSQVNWDWYEGRHLMDESTDRNVHRTKLQIFFKNRQFITSQRNELYGYVDFLANCGGLLGLFMGFSFISLVEILYFATLRLFCNFFKFRTWIGEGE